MLKPDASMDINHLLIPLRELYKRDTKHRELIVEYVNNLKERNAFLPEEFKFLVRYLKQYGIVFDVSLFKAVLAGPLLTVELVPSTCWFSNVRSHISKKEWDVLRRAVYRKAGYICEVCGGRGPQWPLECHEIWHYDDKKHIQTLVGLTGLCPNCHEVKHIGLSGMRGKGEEAEAHLAKVNGWTKEEADVYLKEVWSIWKKRSRYEWELDFSWLDKQGVTVVAQR